MTSSRIQQGLDESNGKPLLYYLIKKNSKKQICKQSDNSHYQNASDDILVSFEKI